MQSKLLIITLFVHDIKTPLAVIEAGVRVLLTTPRRYGPMDTVTAAHLSDILACRQRAVHLLDRILQAARRQGRMGRLKRTVDSLRRFASRLLYRTVEDPDRMEAAFKRLRELTALLGRIEEHIRDLESKPELGPDAFGERCKVVVRMRRNILRARFLCANAESLLSNGRPGVRPSEARLAEVLTAALTDVLDLTASGTSETLLSARNLQQVKELLAGHGVFLQIAESAWQADYLLDPSRVRQVVVNLLANALKFRKSRVDIGIYEEPAQLVITVADDGADFPPPLIHAVQGNRFEMHPATAGNLPVAGHGLGLAGTGAMLQAMGGRLEISPPGAPKCIAAVLACTPRR